MVFKSNNSRLTSDPLKKLTFIFSQSKARIFLFLYLKHSPFYSKSFTRCFISESLICNGGKTTIWDRSATCLEKSSLQFLIRFCLTMVFVSPDNFLFDSSNDTEIENS